LAPATSSRDIKFLAEGWEKLYFPFLFTFDPLQVGEVPWRDLKIPLVYVLLPVALILFCLQRRDGYNTGNDMTNQRRMYIILAGGLSYFAWMLMFGIYRYAIPLEMISALLLYIAIDLFRLHSSRKREIFLGLVIIAISNMQVADWGHTHFSHRFIEVDAPKIENPDNAMILMIGFQPYSHILPAFPKQIPVIRLQSNFSSPEEHKGIDALLRDRVNTHKGDLYLLAPYYEIDWTNKEVMPQFGLKTVVEKCVTFKNNIAEDMSLCPVTRQATR